MKNSATTPANTVATTTTTKAKAQSIAVATVKAVVCIPHIILQTSADLLSLTEAHAVNLIDGTPVIATVMARQSYTQDKMAKAVGFALQQQEKLQAKMDRYRQQDIDKAKVEVEKLTAKIDKLEGVEHITPVATVEPTVPTVPAPPVTEAPFIPINKRGPKSTPVMTAPAV